MTRMTAKAIALLTAAASVVPHGAWPQAPEAQSAATLNVRLSSFAFTPDRLQLRVGVPVRLHLTNESSGGHNFSAPAFFAASTFPTSSPPPNGKIEVAGGSSVDITLTPRVPGTYKVECTHFLHSLFGMTGTIVVTGS